MFILLTARPTGDETTSALPSVYERNETPPYIYIYIYLFSLLAKPVPGVHLCIALPCQAHGPAMVLFGSVEQRCMQSEVM